MSIQIRNLRKSFGGAVAVDGIDVDVGEGKMLVLLGPSGCGKTTTMRCIAGLETPDEGSILIGEARVFDAAGGVDVPINRRNVGMVFQSYAIWPHLTVFDNVAFPLRMQKLAFGDINARVGEILALVGLEQFAERGASYLSGGQMQRVALARSLVMRPSVLLFDEPLSNLDARLRDRLRVQLRELQTQFKVTSVYVTHDQHEALALADEIAVMEQGRILQRGDPVSIYSHPKTSTIADFLGYSNIFKAEIGRDGSVHLVEGGQELAAIDKAPSGGGEFYACIRPDDVRIEKPEAEMRANSLLGEVILSSFMGSFMQYRVRLERGGVMEVFDNRIRSDLAVGTRVRLDIPPAAIRLLPSA